MGKASCSITPNETAGTYTVSGSFGGGTSSTTLLPSSGHNCFVVNKAPTILTYTGQISTSPYQTLTLSSVLTTSNGTPIPGQTVVETLGTGRTAQTCTAVTNSSGVASCTITVNQVDGTVAVTVSYGGNSYYQSSSSSTSERIGCGGGGGGGGGGGRLRRRCWRRWLRRGHEAPVRRWWRLRQLRQRRWRARLRLMTPRRPVGP